jgi:RNA polymerase sigma factor (TIGR02999 family)
MGEVTILIRAARQGDREALDRLFALLYDDLHAIARARVRMSAPDTLLDTTGLVHETYARFAAGAELDVADRRHFFTCVARAMRFVVVDFARRKSAGKRGGGSVRVPIDENVVEALPDRNDEALRVHQGLEELGRVDEDLVRLVEMRYFAGLQVHEIAEALGVAERTVERHWQKARAILFASLA